MKKLLLLVVFFGTTMFSQISNHVVISEVYGGGGNSGAILKNDFVELYNPTDSVVSLDGWSIHYMSGGASGVFPSTPGTMLSGAIAPKGYYLVQQAQGVGGTTALPTPDAIGGLALGGSAGKIILSKASIAVTSLSDPNLVDFVGYGTAAIFEGAGSAPAPSNTNSVERKATVSSTTATMGIGGAEEFDGNAFDSNNNSTDFVTRTPQPQNSASPTEPKSTGADVIAPWVLSMKSSSTTQIEVIFNEPIDSIVASTASNFLISKSVSVLQANRDGVNPGKIVLITSAMANDTYVLTLQNIKDLAGNVMQARDMAFSVGILTIAQARAVGSGLSMRVRGIVTAANEFGTPPVYIQDSTGGVAVFNFTYVLSAKRGDIWEVGGVLKDFNGLLEIDPITDTVRISSNNQLPPPKKINSTTINESVESQLIRVNKVKFDAVGLFASGVDSAYSAGDAFGPVTVYVAKGSNIVGSTIPVDSVNLVGIVGERNGVYRLLPRTLADINVIDPPSSQTWLDINIARAHPDGDTVKVRGIVTYGQPSKTAAKTIFLQDFTAGIAVYDQKSDTLLEGDSVEVKGVLKQFNNLLEVSPADSVRLLQRGLIVPMPKAISIAQSSESFEAQLVKLSAVRFVESGTFSVGTSGTTYNVTDGSSQLNVRIPFGSALDGKLIPVGLIDIVGVVGQFNASYQLIPRTYDDITLYPGPQISSLPVVASLSDTSFTINWSTYFPGTSVVYFGTTKNLGDSIVNALQTTDHSVTVTGLKAGRIYYFQVTSANDQGAATSFIVPQVTTSSASSGQMNVYFNYSVDASYGLQPIANGLTDLLNKLLGRISSATQSIDMAAYSYDDFSGSSGIVADRISDSLIAAHNRGVKIRVVFDNKSTSIPLARLESAGISVMKRTIPGTDGGIMHNKIFVLDGRDTIHATDDWVIFGSWNFTNDGTRKDAQNAIFIQDQSLARIYTAEFEEMFGSSTETKNPVQARFGSFKSDNTPHITYVHGTKIESYFSPTDRTTSGIIRSVSSADNDIFFGVMSFTRSDIAQALIAKKNAGIKVRGIINDQSGSVLLTLQSAGVDAMVAKHDTVKGIFHHKYAVIDPFNDNSDPMVITGSHNWSTNAETDNDENTLIIHSGAVARQYAQEFAKRYKESGGTGVILGIANTSNAVPVEYSLGQNYPNPFNPATQFEFTLPRFGMVRIAVYDILGRVVAQLVNEQLAAGHYTMGWDASQYSSGVYFYRIQAGDFVSTKKMMVQK